MESRSSWVTNLAGEYWLKMNVQPLPILLLRRRISSPVVRAFEQILKDSNPVHIIELDGNIHQNGLEKIPEETQKLKPALLLAGFDEAWAALRLLNIWQDQRDPFLSRRQSADKHQIVVPLLGVSGTSLVEILADRMSSQNNWLHSFLKLWSAHQEGNSSRGDLADSVRKAFLAAIAAQTRHDIRLSNGVDAHGRNDVIAAIRVLQGSILDGWLPARDGQKSCSQILRIAKRQKLQPNANANWKHSKFFDLANANITAKAIVGRVAPFASLLVIDDRGFWKKPFRPVWRRLGLNIKFLQQPSEVSAVCVQSEKQGRPIRVVLLDMRFGDDPLAGARSLPFLRKQLGGIPIVGLSVDDHFSESVALKRMGLFAYINKHALAEPHRGRDAVSAFRQLRDAILIAAFASLSQDLRKLFDVIINALKETVKAETTRAARGASENNLTVSAEISFKPFEHSANRALDVLRDECQRMFHGCWQESIHPAGLACRQIIRALGLVNDKWCSIWRAWRFDPDDNLQYWKHPVDVAIPYQIYHQITTAIRNEASHGMVEDHQFHWLDVWIMTLTLFLKVEGTCHAYFDKTFGEDASRLQHYPQIKKDVTQFVNCLAGLMAVVLKNADAFDLNTRGKNWESVMAVLSKTICKRLQSHSPRRHSDGFAEGDERRLSVQPYVLFSRSGTFSRFQSMTDVKVWASISGELKATHLLLMKLVLRRSSVVF